MPMPITIKLTAISSPPKIAVYHRCRSRSRPPTTTMAAALIHQRLVMYDRRYSYDAVNGSRHRRATRSGCRTSAGDRHFFRAYSSSFSIQYGRTQVIGSASSGSIQPA